MSDEKFRMIARDLELHHGIFSKLWQVGKPVMDKSIERAAIRFDKKGGFFSFCFNPDYFKSIDDYTLKFVICHELQHIILKHGIRGLNLTDHDAANKAMDIVINESLVTSFKFLRGQIKDQERFCWYNTVFCPSDRFEKNKCFEYYYELIKNKNENGQESYNKFGGSGNPQTVDSHEGFCKDASSESDSAIEDAINGLSDGEIENLKDALKPIYENPNADPFENSPAGSGAGGIEKLMALKKYRKKKKWETVIKKWSLKYLKRNDRNFEQWARINRRFVTLQNSSMFIPTEMEIDHFEKKKHKINVVFFLNTSGSCIGLADRFWAAANSLPEDRFELDLCCFDTSVYNTTLPSRRIFGGGGTYFHILEEYVQKKKKELGKYPEAIFVITDGMGNSISPEFPKNWYWFLTQNYTSYIPKDSNKFNLRDYE
jgi:predicted metal-dependent peptidase